MSWRKSNIDPVTACMNWASVYNHFEFYVKVGVKFIEVDLHMFYTNSLICIYFMFPQSLD